MLSTLSPGAAATNYHVVNLGQYYVRELWLTTAPNNNPQFLEFPRKMLTKTVVGICYVLISSQKKIKIMKQ